MKTLNRLLLKFIIFYIICFITNKISDTYFSGGIAGMLCMVAGGVIDKIDEKMKEEK